MVLGWFGKAESVSCSWGLGVALLSSVLPVCQSIKSLSPSWTLQPSSNADMWAQLDAFLCSIFSASPHSLCSVMWSPLAFQQKALYTRLYPPFCSSVNDCWEGSSASSGLCLPWEEEKHRARTQSSVGFPSAPAERLAAVLLLERMLPGVLSTHLDLTALGRIGEKQRLRLCWATTCFASSA